MGEIDNNPNPGIEGQDTTATPEGTEAGEVKNFLTRAEFEQYRKEMEENSRRTAQSYASKAEDRVSKRISDGLSNLERTVETLKATGQELTPAQIDAMRAKVYDEAYRDYAKDANSPSQPKGNPAQGYPKGQPEQDAGPSQVNALITQFAEDTFAELGVRVDESDPEAKIMRDAAKQGPTAFMRAIEKAAKQKAERVKKSPEGRLPQSGSGGGTDLAKRFKEESKLLGRGSAYQMGIVNLRDKYRRLGLTDNEMNL